jgi:hypothetical protein
LELLLLLAWAALVRWVLVLLLCLAAKATERLPDGDLKSGVHE